MFILILVFMVVIIEAGTKLLLPVSRRLADLIGAMAEEKRQVGRGPGRDTDPEPHGLPAALEEIEARLARIEDRLDFLEELKAPDSRPALRSGARDHTATSDG